MRADSVYIANPAPLSFSNLGNDPIPYLPNLLSASSIFNILLSQLKKTILESPSTVSNPNLPTKPWKETFNGVRRALRFLETQEEILQWYINIAKLSPRVIELLDLPCNVVVPFLSRVKTIFHNNCDFIDNSWKNYLDLAVIAGYPKMVDRENVDDPVAWLSTPVTSLYDSEWWLLSFKKTFYQNHVFRVKILSYQDFVLNRWLWVTDGATRFSHAMLDDELVKTKFGAALSLSDSELLQHAFLENEKSNTIGVFLKPDEPGYKKRLIANVSLGPYLVAAYIRYYLEQSVGVDPVYLKLDPSPFDKIDVIDLIKNGRTMVPLDESAYDYHVSRESWEGFDMFLEELDNNNVAFKLFAQYRSEAYWEFGSDRGPWISGMPSGLALTSYLNSWMNYIKQAFILPGDLQFAAGDDVLTAPYLNGVDLDTVAEEYEKFGSSVNASKNWVSQRYSEYLKVLSHSEGTTGYPARVFASLIWAGQVRTFLPSDRLPELSELFKQFYDRLGLPFDVKTVARDLAASVSHKVAGFNYNQAENWLHSPRAYGGFGLLPYRYIQWDWSVDVIKKRQYTKVIIRVPDVNFYSDKVTLRTQRRPLHINRGYARGPSLRLATPTSLEEWEARLNGDDNPIKGKFGRMALDIIPLPTVNGIATSMMASFAAVWDYNVLPNIKGDSNTVVDALVNASIALRNQVLSYLKDRGLKELAN